MRSLENSKDTKGHISRRTGLLHTNVKIKFNLQTMTVMVVLLCSAIYGYICFGGKYFGMHLPDYGARGGEVG